MPHLHVCVGAVMWLLWVVGQAAAGSVAAAGALPVAERGLESFVCAMLNGGSDLQIKQCPVFTCMNIVHKGTAAIWAAAVADVM